VIAMRAHLAVPSGNSTDPPPGQDDSRVTFSPAGWTWVLLSCAAVVLVAVGWPILAAVHHLFVPVAMVLSIATAGAPLLALRWPRTGVVVGAVSALAAALAIAPDSGPWPWPVTTLIAQVLLVFVVSLSNSWRTGAAAWLAGALVSVLAIALIGPAPLGPAIANAVVCAAVSAGALSAGNGVGLLLTSRRQLVRERQLTAEQEGKRRELQQRNRIAQELHDVVAHSMSVISVQATTAPYRLAGLDEPTRAEFSSIADSSRRALAEMRGLLAVLRGDDAAATAPQPTLADIPQLVDTTRSSGATVELEIDPELLPRGAGADPAEDWSAVVAPATGLTAYRVVQEAISNALRHAPGAAIRVQVTVGDQIGVRVANGPAARLAAAAAPGAGLGLHGIRERVTAIGGTVQAGPTPDGGFTVAARLPL
jgi:signal transduction histidine kinase